jgi:hypothetical protein
LLDASVCSVVSELALASFPNPEKIPERNITHAQALGADFFKKVLAYDSSKH